MMLRRTHTSQPCCGGQLHHVVETLGLLAIGSPGRLPSQPAHIAELANTRFVEAFWLHALQDARACPESQDDSDDLGYAGRSVTELGPRILQRLLCPAVDRWDLGFCPGGLADSTASGHRRPSAWGARKACGAFRTNYPSLTTATSGTDSRIDTNGEGMEDGSDCKESRVNKKGST